MSNIKVDIMSKSTIKDVANKVGVSVATVSYVLNGKKKISEPTKKRIYEAIEELNYVPNINAQGLNSHSSRLIGVVVPDRKDTMSLYLRQIPMKVI